MEIVNFNGVRCFEIPKEDWRTYTCQHLLKYISKPGENKDSSIVKILQDGSKSSEVFLFVKGPLPIEINENTDSPVKISGNCITCNMCWINVYSS